MEQLGTDDLCNLRNWSRERDFQGGDNMKDPALPSQSFNDSRMQIVIYRASDGQILINCQIMPRLLLKNVILSPNNGDLNANIMR